MKVKTYATYTCEICGTEYKEFDEAAACEAQGRPKQTLKPGDIVTIGAGYGWFDGDRRWVLNPDVKRKDHADGRNCFDRCCTMAFFYVITKAEECSSLGEHRIRYHLLTKAMSGKQGHRKGYTYDQHHRTPKKVANPPAWVVGDSLDVIGEEAQALI